MSDARAANPLTARDVFRAWWPLAASWLLMGLEGPVVSAAVARMATPTVSLAAFGGVVFPIALLIESPVVMLLAASTALCSDWASYRLVRRCMLALGVSLTALHALVAFTPLYDVVVGHLIHPPPEVLEPARRGLQVMVPWTLSIAYRRFQQGVLIRFERSWAVSVGTVLRLTANVAVLAIGFVRRDIPGVVIGTAAVTAGVMCEALFSGVVVRPVIARRLRQAPAANPALTAAAFTRFYVPLAATPLLAFFAMPLASAAMSRMPSAIESLAAWPVVSGGVFTLRSTGFAMNEVVVSLLDRPRAAAALRRFSLRLALVTSSLLLVTAVSPLGAFWLGRLSALPAPLVPLGLAGVWMGVAFPAVSAMQSWYQGVIVHSRRTRAVTESVALSLGIVVLLLGIGVTMARWSGLPVAMLALLVGNAIQVAWLRYRAGPALAALASAPSESAG